MPWMDDESEKEPEDGLVMLLPPPVEPDLPVVLAAVDVFAAGVGAEPVDPVDALATGFTSTVLFAAVVRRRGVEEGVAMEKKGMEANGSGGG